MQKYRLTPRMRQTLHKSLEKYHELFSGGRCSGWELEELIFKAIQSDNIAQHHDYWREGGHDAKADIEVAVGKLTYYLQIKSGRIRKKDGFLILSGFRLGRFNGDLCQITEYLNNTSAEIVSVSYEKVDDSMGRRHIYQINYVDSFYLHGINADAWAKSGKTWGQENQFGVRFSLRPSMSWQIWWAVPVSLLAQTRDFVIG